ncbi:MAG: molybdopterin molybdotransferase MoeA [Acidimicrobiales bacterium]
MPLLSLEAARRRVLAQCQPVRARAIPIGEALGCVTSVELRADADVPPFANTAVDGFAVRSHDVAQVPATLRVTGTIAAGSRPEPGVGLGEAVRIFTGAPLPPGADAVVMVEDTDAWDGRSGREAGGASDVVSVEVRRAAGHGDNVRSAGDDLRVGQVVFGPGTVLGPGHLGVLASLGVRRVPVHPRARVGVLSTGDELVDGPEELQPGQIRDSNRRTLLALLADTNAEPIDLGLVGDDEVALTERLRDGVARCDAVITSGGVSVGDFDYVKVVLDRLSAGQMSWMQIAIKPAKPFAFGMIDATPVFGLPGNPVSSMVSFELLARPAIRSMMGHARLDRPHVSAVADEALRRRPDGKLHLVRVRAEWSDEDGRFHVRSSGAQASHLLRSMALANALAVLPDGDGVDAGGDVRVMLLSWPD